ncbi:response regulator receiver protein [Maricaulis sp.]|uniref:response regulator receiver protein n=1 Tax=Maricaulis sp. TaxID=1486257 RepID=UPI00262A09E4|nr:response regulator receiver protein [Maricaulis sp.]
MAETDYARASVLLFDPVHANQRTTRYALFEIGFRQIETVSSLAEFKTMLADSAPTLVVAESSATDADVFNLVRAVRRGELGANPFSVILLTTWSRDTGHIRRAIECGADDVIVRPFSTMFAEERVKTLIKGRKDFIVTSDYIGPDRRKDAERGSDAPPVSVPNILKATVENDFEALNEANGWIQEAKETVRAERLRRLAMRIVVTVELHASKHKADEALPVKLDTTDLLRTGRELKAQLIKANRREAAEVSEALLDQIKALGDGSKAPASSLNLIKELAMGAYAAFTNGDTLERSKDEIGRTVSNLRKRLQAKADAAQRRAELAAEQARQDADNGTADGAGQGEAPGIKRAAM